MPIRRDSQGRFAGSGGGGKKGRKGTTTSGNTRAANNDTTKRLLDKGLTGIGSRLKGKNAALYSGTAKTKAGRAQLWNNAEHNQKYASRAVQKAGAQYSKSSPKGMVRGKRK